MSTKGKSPERKGVSRRRFIGQTAAGIGGLAFAGQLSRAWAQSENVIKVGFISPRTGALAGFGEGDPHALGLVRKALSAGFAASDGKTYAVEIIDRDTQSDPVRAGQLAKTLINRDKIDFMMATSTPETVNPVADACEAAGVPCLSTSLPWEAWYFGRGAKPGAPSPFKWTYHFSFGTAEFAKAYLSQWQLLPNNRKVSVMFPNDADGNALRTFLIPLIEKGGFKVIDPGPYENGTSDYAAQIAKFKAEKCEVFTNGPIPPDFAIFWRQAAQQGYTRIVKIAQIAKTGLFPSQVESLGSLGPKLATVAYWHPTFPYRSPITGLTSQQLSEGYEAASGRQWNQQLGGTMALLDAGLVALRRSANPRNRGDVAKALSVLNVTTTVGNLNWTKGPVPNAVPSPLIGGQWVPAKPGSKFKLDFVLTENACDPNVPVGAKLQSYS